MDTVMNSEEIFARIAGGQLDKTTALDLLNRRGADATTTFVAVEKNAHGLPQRVEHYLVSRLAVVLEVPESEIDMEANLMDLGLDSTKLIRLAEQFEQELDITLYPTVFFEHQTLASVAEHFAEEYPGVFNGADTAEPPAASATVSTDAPSDEPKGSTPASEATAANGAMDAEDLIVRVQDYLVNRFAQTLEVPEAEIDVEANLMDLGLDSTKIIQLAEQFERELDITLYPTVFFEYQTLEAVAGYFADEYGNVFKTPVVEGSGENPGQVPGSSDTETYTKTTENHSVARSDNAAKIDSAWPEKACLYQYAWRDYTASRPVSDSQSGTVFVYATQSDVIEALQVSASRKDNRPRVLVDGESAVDVASAERFTLAEGEWGAMPAALLQRFGTPRRVIFFVGRGGGDVEPSREAALAALGMLRDVDNKIDLEIVFAIENDELGCSASFALASFAATIRVEYPRIATTVVTLDSRAELGQWLDAKLPNNAVLHNSAGHWRQRVVEHLAPTHAGEATLRTGGVYLLTGGAGGLGAVFAEDLALRYSARLVLSGRRAEDDSIRALLERIRRAGGDARYVGGDIADLQVAQRVVETALNAFGPVNGVIHAAGIVNDTAIPRKTAADFARVVSPKVLGVRHLDALTAKEPLDFFVTFSSIAAVTGNHGQADYAYANGFLDGFVVQRDEQVAAGRRAGRSLSIQWPLWAEGGMRPHQAVIDFMEDNLGLSPLSTGSGVAAFYRALDITGNTLIYLEGKREAIEAWLQPQPQALAKTQTAPGHSNPASSFTPQGAPRAHNASEDDIAIIGFHGEFPGSPTPDDFWNNLIAGKDLITTDPERWQFDGLADLMGIDNDSQETFVGGFMDDVAAFDPEFFRLSAAEAELIDPQQRRFLQVAWAAIEAAGHNPMSLMGSSTGVFVGASTRDYQDRAVILASLKGGEAWILSPHSSTGLALNNIPNRLSYFLDLKGPSEAIDTACSSSLVALHRAATALQRGDCDLAIVGGVNLLLSPTPFWAFSSTGILSPNSRCRSFADNADGYVRGEGVGAVVLKPRAAAERDGDRIHALVKGSALNHGGRAQSLTTPNPRQQAEVIKQAMKRAGVAPDSISYVEAHGTGTALGDPVEIQGLKRAFRDAGADFDKARCAISTVKSNIGHLEAAAGIAGLIKVLLCMRHGQLPQSLHINTPNPYLDMDKTPFYLLREKRDWPCLQNHDGTTLPRRAGISSFGFGGTNAHVILEQYPQAPVKPACGPTLLLLSARSSDSLRQYATHLHNHLAQAVHNGEEVDLEAIAYTLQVGRTSFREKLALVANNVSEAIEALSAWAKGDKHRKMITGSSEGVAELVPALREPYGVNFLKGLFADGRLEVLAHLWLLGIPVDWDAVNPVKRRVALPTYPFANRRYWFGGLVPSASKASTHQPLIESTAPDLHTYLRAQIAALLKVDAQSINPEKSLAEYGLDSILGMSLVNNIKQYLDMPVYVTEIMRHDTLAKLSAYLEAEVGARGTQSSTQDKKGDEIPPVETVQPITPPMSFILSTPRAGSTLLRTMLQGHERIFAPPELHLLGYSNLAERQQALNNTGLEEGLLEALKNLRHCTAEQAREEVEKLAREGADTAGVYQRLRRLSAPALLVDKSPTYGRDPDTLRQSVKLFPDARYIHLVRDPLAVMESIVRNRFDRLIDPQGDDPWKTAEAIWLEINRNIADFLDTIAENRKLIVRYEDLVREPHRQTTRVCNFFNIEATSEMLNPYGESRMLEGLHQGSLSIGDPNFLNHDRIDASLAERWQGNLPEAFKPSAETVALAAHYGYRLGRDYSLLPAQTQSLARDGQESDWYIVQRFSVQEGIGLDRDRLHEVIAGVLGAHPQLCVVLNPDKGALSQQPVADLVVTQEFEHNGKRVEKVEAKLARMLNITAGPIVGAALVREGKSRPQISLVWHHLVVDGLSAMLLFEDIVAGCCDPSRKFTAKGNAHAYEHYLSAVTQAAQSLGSAPVWIAQHNPESSRIPDLAPEAKNGFAHQREEWIDASSLLESSGNFQNANGYFEYLGAALSQAIAQWSKAQWVVMALRLHGRSLGDESVFPDVLGNFACDVPVCLAAGAPDSMLQEFNDAYDQVSRSGIDYELLRQRDQVPPPWELATIRFNFQPLGHCADSIHYMAECLGADKQRRYLLDFIARQQGDRLQLCLRYSVKHHHRATARRLLRKWFEAVSRLFDSTSGQSEANPVTTVVAG